MSNYPIFNSVANRIESELIRRSININRFKTWDESAINATGLELVVDLSGQSELINAATINFDWDKFREAALARQMEGMSRHPLLKSKSGPLPTVVPSMDVEMSWQFDASVPIKISKNRQGTQRVKVASEWMEVINRRALEIFPAEHTLSRWHVDIEGDFEGRFISQMTYITYYTFALEGISSLSALHLTVDRKLQSLLLTSARMLQLANRTLPLAS